MARLINDSMEIKCIFGEHCGACDSAIETAIFHRFESHAPPLGRTCLFFHACVKTALHLTKARTDVSAKKAKDWLLWISEEHLLKLRASSGCFGLLVARLLRPARRQAASACLELFLNIVVASATEAWLLRPNRLAVSASKGFEKTDGLLENSGC